MSVASCRRSTSKLLLQRLAQPTSQLGARHHSSNPLSKPSINSEIPQPKPDERTTHFGFKEVPESLKESLVGSVFTSVSPKYDVLNDSMSLGVHRLWKDSFVSALLPKLPPSMHSPTGDKEWQPSFRCLDVAGGTGDIALRILDRAREKYGNRDVQVEIVDLNEGMLHEGVKRVAQTMYYNTPQIKFTHGNAQSLPTHIVDNSIDLYTIAFGIRNCTSLPAVLSEAYRVLKPGGRLGVLEFGKVSNPLFREFYKQWSFSVIPLMGQILAGDRDSYQYLVESIAKFPSQPEFAKLVQEAGFQVGEMREGGAWTDYTNGICTFWRGVKA
ncbi:hypothetical protein QFC24_005017 [Naganishia onofrii]|uniref:Uncharacterized protein n=1 Tax=Naganishia onofrii TaxID=1851511 RepID=A0ACC2XCC5_9TREE|nr:hypothetical protein QFC24_005017 [Naganishia onofrii]